MIVSLSLPDRLVQQMDQAIEGRGYRGRSELARTALLHFLRSQQREEQTTGRMSVIVVLGYPERAERNVSEVRHQHNDLVTSMLHAHTLRARCSTVLVGAGEAEKMRAFLTELRGIRDLESIEVTVLE
ncbi:MAG TPA: CopG family ribbon-helix-helix protein [Candidatus Thermoplasmatota archaeon]|nr:CopG family ribbon-helix-helix protein [Candidatus Thermoplasmatota archaeon]